MFRLFLVSVLFVSGASLAQGQSMLVIGESPAAQCYRSAADGRGDYDALRECNLAIEEVTLTRNIRARTLVNRAVVYLNRGNGEQALDDLRAARRMGFDVAEIPMNMSAAYIQVGNHDAAIDSATRALDMGLEEVEKAYFNRAVAYERLGNIAQAYLDYTAAVEAAPDWSLPRRELERFQVSENGS